MDNSFNEQRKSLRIYRNFILVYYEKGSSTAVHDVSQVNNVSKGGLNFSSTRLLKHGDILMIDLKTPFIGDSIHLEGIVLESKEKVPGMIFENRIQFLKVPEEVLGVLEKIESYGKANEG